MKLLIHTVLFQFQFPLVVVVITTELLQLRVVMNMVFITKYINTQPERICMES